ncbi:unnamed protein product [Echinostoma caproni]|uniref:Protein kinase domain-containing protein n=1 Tax=Echinostoma caproni TaxID=27848 RepID=A0A183ATU7_9TREM|nr:unnamed protein product [Echinostoma caproni]
MLTKDPNIRPSATSLLRHPFVKRHMRELFRHQWMSQSMESHTIEEQMDMLKQLWQFPDGILQTEESELQTDVGCNPEQELDEHAGEEREPHVEIDLTTLTPRQRIRMNLHTEADITAAVMRFVIKKQVPLGLLDENPVLATKVGSIDRGHSARKLPQERLLEQLRQLGRESKSTGKNEPREHNSTVATVAVHDVNDDEEEEDEEDLSWPYSTITDGKCTGSMIE